MPEFFWIAKLIEDYGPQLGVETARAFAEAASTSCVVEPKPMFATSSSFSKASQDEQGLLVSNLPRRTRELLQNALNPMATVWAASPFSFLTLETELSPREALQEISPLLRNLYDRHSRESTLTISTVVYLGLDQNKIRISAEIMENRASAFRDIEDYPETEESRSAGSFFRAMAPMCRQMQKHGEGNESDLWQKSFWDGVSDLGECIGVHQELQELPSTTEGFGDFVVAFSHFAHKDLRERQNAWPIDLQKTSVSAGRPRTTGKTSNACDRNYLRSLHVEPQCWPGAHARDGGRTHYTRLAPG